MKYAKNIAIMLALAVIAVICQQPAEAMSVKAKNNVKKVAGIVLIPVRVGVWVFFSVATVGAIGSGYIGLHLENALIPDPVPVEPAADEPEVKIDLETQKLIDEAEKLQKDADEIIERDDA